MQFHNRTHAGLLLAQKMSNYIFDKKETIVLAIGIGGVAVACKISEMFHLPLDIILIKKIGAPNYPELAIGSISENNEVFYNDLLLDELSIKMSTIAPVKEKILDGLIKEGRIFRKGQVPISLYHKNVILVDDGVITGSTMESVLLILKKRNVNKVIIATPVASAEALLKFEKKVDSIVVLRSPNPVYTISEWYKDFKQIEKTDVTQILNNQYTCSAHSNVTLNEKKLCME